MKKVVGFGDFLVSFNPPGHLRFVQTDRFEISYTGAEANALIALSWMGVPTEFVTRLPENDIARAAVASLKKYGVGTDRIAWGGDRIGTLYLEFGASCRAAKVIYDRRHSAICSARPSDFNWERIFDDAGQFHLTGITPALSDGAAESALTACQEAKKRNIPVSFDLNYRQTLWTPKRAKEVMERFFPFVDLLIANVGQAESILEIPVPTTAEALAESKKSGESIRLEDESESVKESFAGWPLTTSQIAGVARRVRNRYGVAEVALTLRREESATENLWGGMILSAAGPFFSRTWKIHVVNRIGGGDAFSAGLLYGKLAEFDPQKTVEFAAAASSLKHSIEYDFNLVTVAEVTKLVEEGSSTRVQR